MTIKYFWEFLILQGLELPRQTHTLNLLTGRQVDLTNKIVQKNVCVHNVHLSGSQGSTNRLSYPVYSQVAERGCYLNQVEIDKKPRL